MTDYSKLRELAEKATPGPWRAANGKGSASVACGECAIYINVRTCEVDECVERWQADARFIAACDPQTVVGLLDRIEHLEQALHHTLAADASVDGWVRLKGDFDDAVSDVAKAENLAMDFRQQLDAMTRARDEACTIAENWIGDATAEVDAARIATLRKVGH